MKLLKISPQVETVWRLPQVKSRSPVSQEDTFNRWSDAFLYYPDVQEAGDGLYLPVEFDGVTRVRFTTYGTNYRTVSYPDIAGLAAHRVQLAARKALMCATLTYDDAANPTVPRYHSYTVARPGELWPRNNSFQFGALLGCSWEEVDEAVLQAATASDYERPRMTPAELCERLGRSELVETLDTPRIFIGVSRRGGEQVDSLLQPWPAHKGHHMRIQRLTDAVAVPISVVAKSLTA